MGSVLLLVLMSLLNQINIRRFGMKESFYSVIIIIAYSTSLLVFLFSFDEMSLSKALIYNMLGGGIVLVILFFIERLKNNKK